MYKYSKLINTRLLFILIKNFKLLTHILQLVKPTCTNFVNTLYIVNKQGASDKKNKFYFVNNKVYFMQKNIYKLTKCTLSLRRPTYR